MTTIKDRIYAAMHGMTPEEYDLQKAKENLKSVTSEFLDQHPEYLLKSAPVDTATKRIKKSLGADSRPVVAHTADHLDPELLARAKKAARDLAAADPERYGNVIKQQEV